MKKLFTTVLLLAFGLFVSSASGADFEQRLDELIPRLAAAKVEDRYAPQMQLQELALKAARPGAESERVALAKLLAEKASDSSVPQPARVWFVRQLEYIGGVESLKTLAQLLQSTDAELRECARRALERNPAPAATKILRTALKTGGSVDWRAGLIHSLGERHAADSVDLIARELKEPQLAPVAVLALSQLDTKSAMKQLWPAVDSHVDGAAEALISAAARLAGQGHLAEANAICARLMAKCGEPRLRSQLLPIMVKAEPREADKLIRDALLTHEPKLQSAAVATAQSVYGQKTAGSLFNVWSQLDSSGKILVLTTADASVEPQVISAVNDSDAAVQAQAIEALQRIGTEPSLSTLLALAAGKSPAAPKAVAALGRIHGASITQKLENYADAGQPALRRAAINALVERNAPNFTSTLLKYVQEPTPEVRDAACNALAKLGSERDLETLTRLALKGESPRAESAARLLASRARDKDAAAKTLLNMADTAPSGELPVLFGVLSAVGGSNALDTISRAVASTNADVRNAAIQALADWPEFAATKPLLCLATNSTTSTSQNALAVQAIVRLLNDDADGQSFTIRIDVALAALQAARRVEDKKQVLSTFHWLPDARTAEAVQPLLDSPDLKQEAALAGMALADEMFETNKSQAKALAAAVKRADVSSELTARAEKLLGPTK